MRIYRIGIKTCFLLCIISLACCLLFLGLISSSYNDQTNNDQSMTINNFAYDISIGIFASGFVVFLTYFVAYFIEKKKTIGKIKYYCSEYILELKNLIPLLIEISEDGAYKYNWENIKTIIEGDSKVNRIIQKQLRIYNDRLLNVEGFFPILKGNKKNLQIHHLICMFAKVNGAVQYCNTAYELKNSIILKLEQEDLDFSEEKLKEQLDILLQTNENKEYQRFLELITKVQKQYQSPSVYNSTWESKCR